MYHLDLRQEFLIYFMQRDHRIVPSSSLLPVDDPSVLLTTAGMQQFKPYFVGVKDPQADFGTLNAVSVQKCFRADDINDIGDDTHLTFFEMLGNFSFGGYWKAEAIAYAWEFLTDPKWLGISPSRIHANYYNGNRSGTVEDTESRDILQQLDGLQTINATDDSETFWGPTGSEGPCGPTVEFYVDGVEVWNLVFNEFYCHPDRSLTPLATRGVDTGMGLERILAAVNQLPNIFETDLFARFNILLGELPARSRRIVADHARASVFLLGDFVIPSNKEQGYILRRVLRRMLIHLQATNITLEQVVTLTIDTFAPAYPELSERQAEILAAARAEADKFSRTLQAGTRELDKLIADGVTELSGEQAFKLFATYGLPIDYMKEKISIDTLAFDQAFADHQALSRAGAEAKFGGHGLSAGMAIDDAARVRITALHTATHLLHAALRQVLGTEVEQAGSDINPDRTRFDFTFSRKLTDAEKESIQEQVNHWIAQGFVVDKATLPYAEAIESGAIAFFKEKYPEIVDVYSVVDNSGQVISRELCGGPHVQSSQELGHFRIAKEESSSAGIRRIKAVLE